MRIAAAVLALVAPVAGPVTRGFDYGPDPFLAGQHRGIDLAARRGSVVRAACTGAVATASMNVVTLRCGAWRVTELPLASVTVRVGARVRAGEVVGRVGALPGHAGLHLGVRRAGDPFAYVDPAPLLGKVAPHPPIVAAPRITREGPRPGGAPEGPAGPVPAHAAPAHSAPARVAPAHAAPAHGAPARVVPAAHGAPATAPTASLRPVPPGGVRVSADVRAGGLAPWPAWVGLGLLALGAVGGGVRIRLRRRPTALAEAAAEGVPSAP
jgi:hypothetical protein